jgi:hypothetical protein
MGENYLLAAARYVEFNPVRAGLAERPEAHPWSSSAKAHVTGCDHILVKVEPVLKIVGTRSQKHEFTINVRGYREVKAWMSQDRIKIQSSSFREMLHKLDLGEDSILAIKIIHPFKYYEASKIDSTS